jgi:CheY-like chemotaxis protein
MAKLVFCEDNPTIQKMIRVALRGTEHDVYISDDGVEGLEVIEREHPDVIFTDVLMPRLDGLGLTDAVKKRPDLAHIPVILVSASAQRIQLEEGFRHGAVDYLTKPFSPAELRAKVEEYANHEQPVHGAGGHR